MTRVYNWGIRPGLEAVREGFLEDASGELRIVDSEGVG